MAYAAGLAGDMVALRTAFLAACTANGWSLSGDILHKGGVYIIVQISGGFLTLRGSPTVDGSGELGHIVRLGRPSTLAPDLAWPLTYEISIHDSPDEVYLVVSYDVDKYQFSAFGISTVGDLPATGLWYTASLSSVGNNSAWPAITISALGGGTVVASPNGLFWRNSINLGACNSVVHHGLDGSAWSAGTTNLSASQAVSQLTGALPNAWNSEAVLLPISPWLPRAENKVSMVADLHHSRYMRIDNHLPGEILEIGPDSWKIYPFYRKNAIDRNGGVSVDHTGTFGWAIRYDGP